MNNVTQNEYSFGGNQMSETETNCEDDWVNIILDTYKKIIRF